MKQRKIFKSKLALVLPVVAGVTFPIAACYKKKDKGTAETLLNIQRIENWWGKSAKEWSPLSVEDASNIRKTIMSKGTIAQRVEIETLLNLMRINLESPSSFPDGMILNKIVFNEHRMFNGELDLTTATIEVVFKLDLAEVRFDVTVDETAIAARAEELINRYWNNFIWIEGRSLEYWRYSNFNLAINGDDNSFGDYGTFLSEFHEIAPVDAQSNVPEVPSILSIRSIGVRPVGIFGGDSSISLVLEIKHIPWTKSERSVQFRVDKNSEEADFKTAKKIYDLFNGWKISPELIKDKSTLKRLPFMTIREVDDVHSRTLQPSLTPDQLSASNMQFLRVVTAAMDIELSNSDIIQIVASKTDIKFVKHNPSDSKWGYREVRFAVTYKTDGIERKIPIVFYIYFDVDKEAVDVVNQMRVKLTARIDDTQFAKIDSINVVTKEPSTTGDQMESWVFRMKVQNPSVYQTLVDPDAPSDHENLNRDTYELLKSVFGFTYFPETIRIISIAGMNRLNFGTAALRPITHPVVLVISYSPLVTASQYYTTVKRSVVLDRI